MPQSISILKLCCEWRYDGAVKKGSMVSVSTVPSRPARRRRAEVAEELCRQVTVNGVQGMRQKGSATAKPVFCCYLL
jgi:hypothetical protein